MRSIVAILVVSLSTSVLACQSDSTSTKGKIVNATIETTKGSIEVELYETDAPKTVANFVGLAKEGYFNGIIVHRISKGFVIQTGDPTGTGAGGRSIYGGSFEDELFPATPSYQTGYVRGTLAMANRGPNTNTSQFFIVLQDAPWLPKNYTIFGRVTKGMEVVDSIAAVPITPSRMGPTDGKPVQEIKMTAVTVKP
jgi:cyclophilin family peptidyl-prolyl cis-trans isomerase